MLKFEACTDFRGINPITENVVPDPKAVFKALGFQFQKVTISGVAASFSLVGRSNWHMRLTTLLEGRAVIACLQWILWNFEGHPKLGRFSRNT